MNPSQNTNPERQPEKKKTIIHDPVTMDDMREEEMYVSPYDTKKEGILGLLLLLVALAAVAYFTNLI